MNLKGHIGIAAHPDLRLRARMDRLDFALQGDATLALGTQTIRIEVGEVPLRLAIPFHRHRRVVAGSLGPFRLTVRPIEATLRIAEALKGFEQLNMVVEAMFSDLAGRVYPDGEVPPVPPEETP